MPINLRNLLEESRQLLKETEMLKIQSEELSKKWDGRLRKHKVFQLQVEEIINSMLEES